MKKMLLAAALTAAAFGFTGCAQHETKETASGGTTASSYETALAAAKAEQKKAAADDAEWRDTGKMIKQAEEAAASGDYDKAQDLADKAAAQGRIAQEQAKGQVNAGNPDYLYR